VYGPLAPQDVSPSDLGSGVLASIRTCGYMAPPPFESAGYAAWLVWGALPFSRPHHPSRALWEWVLLLLYGADSGSRVIWAFMALRPAQGGTLNNLGAVWYSVPVRPWAGTTLPMSDLEALRSFSGYDIAALCWV